MDSAARGKARASSSLEEVINSLEGYANVGTRSVYFTGQLDPLQNCHEEARWRRCARVDRVIEEAVVSLSWVIQLHMITRKFSFMLYETASSINTEFNKGQCLQRPDLHSADTMQKRNGRYMPLS